MVVQDEPGALRVVERVVEREGEVARCGGDLREAAERTERRDAVALGERRAGGSRDNAARDLAAGHERQLRFQLVFAAGLQQLGEGDAGAVHLDEHRVVTGERVGRRRRVDLDEFERALGASFGDDL